MALHLLDNDIGHDIIFGLGDVALPRLGVELGHGVHNALDLFQIDLEPLGNLFEPFVGKIFEAIFHHADGQLVLGLLLPKLDEQALLQVSGGQARRIESLKHLKHSLHGVDLHVQIFGDQLHGAGEIAPFVDAPQHVFANDLLGLVQRCQVELFHEVVHQGDGRRLGPVNVILHMLLGRADLVVVLVIDNGIPIHLQIFGGLVLLFFLFTVPLFGPFPRFRPESSPLPVRFRVLKED